MEDRLAAKELLDVFDATFRRIGTKPREDVHKSGDWHQTVHCWFVRPGEDDTWLLLQRRQLSKHSNPGKFDVSVGGHLLAGEEPSDVVRECEEELGVSMDGQPLSYVGTFPLVQDDGDMVDREYCHVFVYETTMGLTAYRPVLDEVLGLYEVRLVDFVRLVSGNAASLPLDGYVYDAQGPRRDRIQIRRDDVVKRSRAYDIALWNHLGISDFP